MAISKENDRIGLTVSIELKKELQQMADKDGRKLANFCVKILTDHVEQQRRAGEIPEKIEQESSDSDNS